MGLHNEDTPGSQPRDQFSSELPSDRGAIQFGLRYRQLGTQTIQVTGGDDATDTFLPKDDDTDLVAAAVAWTTSHNATAAAIAQAINSNAANHNWVATVATDTVTLRQRTSGAAGTITCTVANDATVTIANSGNPTGDTDTWTEFVSGATFDGDQYYELGFDGDYLIDNGGYSDITDLIIRALDLYCDGQGFTLWQGGLRANSGATALVQGIAIATATWLSSTLGAPLPWLNADIPLVIKLDADEELLYKAHVI